jgi:kumamolisin
LIIKSGLSQYKQGINMDSRLIEVVAPGRSGQYRKWIAATICSTGFIALGAQAQESSALRTPGAQPAAAESQSVASYAAPAGVFVPDSSKQNAADKGLRAHTNYVIHNPRGIHPNAVTDLAVAAPMEMTDETPAEPSGDAGASPSTTFAEYPASLSCVYKMGAVYAGCAPTNNAAYNAKGGNRAIAVVDAYDNPTALADFKYFSQYFGLTGGGNKLKKVYANGNGSCVTPPYNSDWAVEEALDVQWAHAMAPSATIILVEACSNSFADLFYAEQVAIQQVNAHGGGEISNSWSGAEFSTEGSSYDSTFRSNWQSGAPITFFASADDVGLGAQYPSASPWVISAGGTTINRDSSGNFQSESCWAGSGGGTSVYEVYGTTNILAGGPGPWANYQYELFGQANRSTPDMSFDADPASGVYVYLNGSWLIVGGTSLSSPALAGVVNNSNQRLGIAPSAGGYYNTAEHNLIYAQLQTNKDYGVNFYDVTTGSNGASAGPGYDQCTGVGSPRGKVGK